MIYLTVVALTFFACGNKTSLQPENHDSEPTANAAARESHATTFNAQAIPQKKVDIREFSSGIQHVGIPSSDIQKTIDFYTGLGFTLVSRKDIGGRDFAFLQLGTLMVEAIPNDSPCMEAGAIDHICLDAKTINVLFNQLKEAGYQLLNDELVDFDAWENGTKLFFIMGPNNEKIEFCEIL